jgi:hypothetical protein
LVRKGSEHSKKLGIQVPCSKKRPAFLRLPPLDGACHFRDEGNPSPVTKGAFHQEPAKKWTCGTTSDVLFCNQLADRADLPSREFLKWPHSRKNEPTINILCNQGISRLAMPLSDATCGRHCNLELKLFKLVNTRFRQPWILVPGDPPATGSSSPLNRLVEGRYRLQAAHSTFPQHHPHLLRTNSRTPSRDQTPPLCQGARPLLAINRIQNNRRLSQTHLGL